MSEDEQTALDTIRRLVETRYQRDNWREWQQRTPELTAALRALSRDQAHLLAGELWARYDHEKIVDFLGQLNTSVPGALAEWAEAFATQGLLLPSWLYLGASPSATRHLLNLLDQPASSLPLNGILLALAWAGDELVRDQFRTWRESPPPWRSELYVAPYDYAVEAGWELAPEGGRRELYHQTCYELVPVDEPELTPSTHVVAVSTPTEVVCGWCGRNLVALLDVDLRDPRSAFLVDESDSTTTMHGTRLRLAHCLWCSAYATLYTDVDLHGGVAWSAANEAMPRILEQVGMGAEDELPPPAPRRLVLGPKRRTPFEAVGRFMVDETGISQLGGHPEWIQDAEYPLCPDCQRRMICIGQVSWEDLEDAEGST